MHIDSEIKKRSSCAICFKQKVAPVCEKVFWVAVFALLANSVLLYDTLTPYLALPPINIIGPPLPLSITLLAFSLNGIAVVVLYTILDCMKYDVFIPATHKETLESLVNERYNLEKAPYDYLFVLKSMEESNYIGRFPTSQIDEEELHRACSCGKKVAILVDPNMSEEALRVLESNLEQYSDVKLVKPSSVDELRSLCQSWS